MDKAFKSVLYHFGMSILKLFWQLRGSRHITAFGVSYKVAPETVFPDHRHLRLPQGDYLSEIVRYTDFVQMHAVFRYVSEITSTPVIIDVGAHHGAYAVILGKAVQRIGGKVIAIEPNPESFEILSGNIHLNKLEGTVICEQKAVLAKCGVGNIEFDGTESHLKRASTGCEVEVTTLEYLMNKHSVGNVALLMIDVEGAELLVLQGFPWEFTKPERIYCEFHPYAWKDFGYTGKDVQKFLMDRGYRCIDMYLKEHEVFDTAMYVGPTLFMPT
jgi:FkbM family methyltransferase